MADFLVLDTDRDIYGELKGKNFAALIKCCFEEADLFSLSKWDRPSYTNAVENISVRHVCYLRDLKKNYSH